MPPIRSRGLGLGDPGCGRRESNAPDVVSFPLSPSSSSFLLLSSECCPLHSPSNPSKEQDPHVTGGEHEAHEGEQAAQPGHGLLGRSEGGNSALC